MKKKKWKPPIRTKSPPRAHLYQNEWMDVLFDVINSKSWMRIKIKKKSNERIQTTYQGNGEKKEKNTQRFLSFFVVFFSLFLLLVSLFILNQSSFTTSFEYFMNNDFKRREEKKNTHGSAQISFPNRNISIGFFANFFLFFFVSFLHF